MEVGFREEELLKSLFHIAGKLCLLARTSEFGCSSDVLNAPCRHRLGGPSMSTEQRCEQARAKPRHARRRVAVVVRMGGPLSYLSLIQINKYRIYK